ncbi:neuraminidase-like domain-containing protein [Chitinophaga sp. RAB17]|uniref:Tc toxin subunit A-related protein n=1 Tax=Chitinophaga sp. RAB17 TaxID=3233049 RepID=UPI003F8EA21C
MIAPKSDSTHLFHADFGNDKALLSTFTALLTTHNGDAKAAISTLEGNKAFTPELLNKLQFTAALASWSGNNTHIVDKFQKDKATNTLRDIALHFNQTSLADSIPDDAVPAGTDKTDFAKALHTRLFQHEPTAVVVNMVKDPKVPLLNTPSGASTATVLEKNPDFNIRSHPVYDLLNKADVLKDVSPDDQEKVKNDLKSLQRIVRVSPAPEAVPALLSANFTTGLSISEMPRQQFTNMMTANGLDENTAASIHEVAMARRVTGEQAMASAIETMRGTGIALIDQSMNAAGQATTNPTPTSPLDWNALFADADFCECGECTSVYSAASYFVELLQYLRNNNLSEKESGADPSIKIKSNPADISGTPLQKLFDRRPDLGCLELTCANTNTILPYVDLVNEVMEQYAVYNDPKKLKAFNVSNETSSELLAQPQHTNYQAYTILSKAVYPFNLPYHQPIDVIRNYLEFLQTSRYELMDTFRSPRQIHATPTPDPVGSDADVTNPDPDPAAARNVQLDQYHHEYLTRATDAEYLKITQDEYIILTKEAFVSKNQWDLQCNHANTAKAYHDAIQVKPVCDYYGYDDPSKTTAVNTAEMLSTDDATMVGLQFVKRQLLPRTGIQYSELVALLKTRFLNFMMPEGRALTIMESLPFSYRYLMTLSLKEQLEAIHNPEKWAASKGLDFKKPTPDPCQPKQRERPIDLKEIEHWLICSFKQVGKIIVLDEGCHCINGTLIVNSPTHNIAAAVASSAIQFEIRDCVLYREERKQSIRMATIDCKTGIITFEGEYKSYNDSFKSLTGSVVLNNKTIGHFQNNKFSRVDFTADCDISKTVMIHLDGSSVTEAEYDRFHRFIRLWRKLEWSIDETDKAIMSLSYPAGNTFDPLDCQRKTIDDCSCENKQLQVWLHYNINTALIHELVAVKKLLDLTGLELIKLLSFWSNISTAGDPSLYARLLLTHNITGEDTVFQPDSDGNYLTTTILIKDHIPVLMSAFNLSSDDLNAILTQHPTLVNLTLANLSFIYRYTLLAKVIGLRIPDFIAAWPIFGDPFTSADATLTFINNWTKMDDAGFDYRQLNYILHNIDNTKKPFTPALITILQLAKNMYDGLNGIDTANPDLVAADLTASFDDQQADLQNQASNELVKTKVSLLYNQAEVTLIMGILNGTNIFSTNVPAHLDTARDGLDSKNDLIASPPSADLLSLRTKLIYDWANGRIQVTGVLTPGEITAFKDLSIDPNWDLSMDRITKQQDKQFKLLLAGVCDSIKNILLQGDKIVTADQMIDGLPDPNTAPVKRLAFLNVFLPYLRQQLYHSFIISRLSDQTGMDLAVTDLLVSTILQVPAIPTPVPVYNIFESIKNSTAPAATGWNGFLIPASDSVVTFIVQNGSTTVAPVILLGNTALPFVQQDDPTNEWWSVPTKLLAGKIYTFQVNDLDSSLKDLSWKTATAMPAPIPTAVLLPDFASNSTSAAYTLLIKAAILINGFSISADEVNYIFENVPDFGIDFNAPDITQWLRLEAYTRLRNSLPPTGTNLLEFLQWTGTAGIDKTQLVPKIAALTLWDPIAIGKLITPAHFNWNDPVYFKNEINLLTLQQAIGVTSKIGMDVDQLFNWAQPGATFPVCHTIAESINKAIHAKYKQTDWEQVIKPANDLLRNHQKDALIGYLLVDEKIQNWGVTDANGLFEYFLIDVQMDAVMETSRIVQAISSVQLFIQRCFLGLEADKSGISNDILDRDRWDWMQRYRVWEANRKVFLYPENWIESDLRDDKSAFFKELESELLQKDINKQNITDALKSYLYKIHEISNMEVVGFYIDGTPTGNQWSPGAKLHVFSRTRNTPFFFYYRYLDLVESNWYPWEKMQIDIPSYDITDKEILIVVSGTHKYKSPYTHFYLTHCSIKGYLPNTPDFSGGSYTWKGNVNTIGVLKKISIHVPALDGTAVGRIIQTSWDKDNFTGIFMGLLTRTRNTNGCFLIPVVWNDRLLIFFPQMIKKTKPAENGSTTFNDLAKTSSNDNRPIDYYEIKMGWSEYQNGKWTQKQIGSDFFNSAPISIMQDIEYFKFVPVIYPDHVLINVDDKYDSDGTFRGAFSFNGNVINNASPVTTEAIPIDFFNQSKGDLYSWQIASSDKKRVNKDIYFESPDQVELSNGLPGTNNFNHPFSSKLLGNINLPDVASFFSFNLSPAINKGDTFGAYTNQQVQTYHELKRPYSLYNWELFFHAPMMLANALSEGQQFEEAMKWYHYVFNPMAKGKDDTRFWQFAPFKEMDSKSILDKIFNQLQANTAAGEDMTEWRNHPFMPHVVARNRPVAYMKWVVMKYIDNLVAWGDYLFRQDSIESINQATQMYILAYHILGQRPSFIPVRGKIQPQTYKSLLNKWDAFGNAIVELELVAPFSNQLIAPGVVNAQKEIEYANIFGFAATLYFCIPNNPTLMGYWDTLDDRLFKIRHSENIEGVFRILPLFQPPIDPALLVNAAAQGLSIDAVLNDLNTSMPNYRFFYLLQKALELCNELKSLGAAILSAIEKGDNESLSLIRAKHEGVMQNLQMEIKKKQVDEAQSALEGLQQNRKSPVYRMQYYLQLIGEDAGKVPDIDTDYSEIANAIEMPIDDSGLKLIAYEQEDMNMASLAAGFQLAAGTPEVIAGILFAIPMITGAAEPFGVGVGTSYGGSNLGQAAQTMSKALQMTANYMSYQSASAAKKGGFKRALQERVMQANAAGYEIKQIDKQIASQQIRIAMANQDIINQQKQIDNSQEIEDFLKNKYSNAELYTWMKGKLKTLYRQVYSVAYDIAQKAEKTYRFERGLSSTSFIQNGYWDASHDGLLAGEQLYVGLKQLEAAYQENRGYDYEINKHISIRQLNPLALLSLKENGFCEFSIPEYIFDMDYPGHYKRRIKAVSISVPCIAGPYTGLNATLRLLDHTFRNSALATTNNYPEKTDESDDRFMKFMVPISAIAASSGQNDSGMFELNFKDERYLPFEGAGVISKWRFELPTFQQFDYDTITDIIISIRYTAVEGGDRLKLAATKSVTNFIKKTDDLAREEGLFIFVDLKHDLPTEWHKAMTIKDASGNNTMDLSKLTNFLPYYATYTSKHLVVQDFFLVSSDQTAIFSLNSAPLTDSQPIGALKSLALTEPADAIKDWKLSIQGMATPIDKAFVVLRFTLS